MVEGAKKADDLPVTSPSKDIPTGPSAGDVRLASLGMTSSTKVFNGLKKLTEGMKSQCEGIVDGLTGLPIPISRGQQDVPSPRAAASSLPTAATGPRADGPRGTGAARVRLQMPEPMTTPPSSGNRGGMPTPSYRDEVEVSSSRAKPSSLTYGPNTNWAILENIAGADSEGSSLSSFPPAVLELLEKVKLREQVSDLKGSPLPVVASREGRQTARGMFAGAGLLGTCLPRNIGSPELREMVVHQGEAIARIEYRLEKIAGVDSKGSTLSSFPPAVLELLEKVAQKEEQQLYAIERIEARLAKIEASHAHRPETVDTVAASAPAAVRGDHGKKINDHSPPRGSVPLAAVATLGTSLEKRRSSTTLEAIAGCGGKLGGLGVKGVFSKMALVNSKKTGGKAEVLAAQGGWPSANGINRLDAELVF